jgi:hypothetical protein
MIFTIFELVEEMVQKRKAASEILEDKSREKKARLKAPELLPANDWEEMDLTANSYRIIESNHVQAAATLNFPVGTSLLDIFLSFVTIPLLESIWQDLASTRLKTNGRSTVFGGEFNVNKIYQFLAIQIRIICEQKPPKESGRHQRALRDAFKRAKDQFGELFPDVDTLGIKILELLSSRFLITNNYFDVLSRNFQAVLNDLGQIIAGDEKLLHFTVKSGDIRMVPSKPDRAQVG